MPLNSVPPARDPALEMERSCRSPWDCYLPPIRMAAGVYYVSGNDWVASYLIETEEGLILIDAAMHETVYLLLENLRKLGHKPSDIKKILISHAHIDHLGGAKALKELTGATLYVGARDLLFLKERKDLIGNEGAKYTCGDLEPDALYSDETPIQLGSVSVRTVSTPGHTPGCTSFFFDIRDVDGKTRRCGMHGGVGLNTMSREYFRESGLPISLRDEYIAGLERLDAMEVDICLPSHTNQVGILRLVDKISEAYNPYFEPSIWHELMHDRLQKVLDLVKKEEGCA